MTVNTFFQDSDFISDFNVCLLPSDVFLESCRRKQDAVIVA
jgi:hypothetical protein